jgi:uracil-DNA glycosylase
MYGDGRGWVPDEIISGARCAVVAQAPGADEERGQKIVGWEPGPRGRSVPVYQPVAPAPLLGKTGWDCESTYFPLAGLRRGEVSLLNVLKCRLSINGRKVNDLPQGRVLEQAVQHCTAAHFKLPHVDLVIAMGALAARYLGCPGSISSWRGYTWRIPEEVAA